MTQLYRIIGGDKKEYGPVNADDIRTWLAEGRLNAQSLVREEQSSEWKPLSAYPEFAEALGLSGPTAPAGGTPPPLSSADWTRQVLAEPAHLGIGACLSGGGRLWMQNFGLLTGACFVVWLLSLTEFIPLLGLVYKIGWGVVYGGLYVVFLKRLRGEDTAIGDVFSGFSSSAGQLILAGFISSLLAGIGALFCILPGIYLTIAWVFCVPLVADKRLEFWSAMELSRKTVTKVWFQMFALVLLAFLPMVVVNIVVGAKIGSYMLHAIHQAVSAGQFNPQQFMDSMQQVTGTTVRLGLLAKLMLLLNLPFGVGAVMSAYEALFGPRRAAAP